MERTKTGIGVGTVQVYRDCYHLNPLSVWWQASRRAFGLHRLALAEAVQGRHADSLHQSRRRTEAALDHLASLMSSSDAREEAAERSRATAAAAQRQTQRQGLEAARAGVRAAMEGAVRRAWSADLRDRDRRRMEEAERTRQEARAQEERSARLTEEGARRRRRDRERDSRARQHCQRQAVREH